MATRIRTLDFLPEVFRTPTNSQFLNASLDQIVDQPNIQKIQGYIGSKFGYGINASDYYVTEPDQVRTNYQLEPGVVFTKNNETTANDFISYPGINDTITTKGGLANNNSRLYESQFYSWDSFTNLDALINYNQYYWLPNGLPAVEVGSDVVFNINDYVVTDLANDYEIAPAGSSSGFNPTLTLLRGGTYTFAVNQSTNFWIQGAPGVTGYDPTNPNLQTRNVYGVTNNGAETGIVTFNVPYANDQTQYLIPGNLTVDLVCDIPFVNIESQFVNTIGNIDGVTALLGKTIMFYNTGIQNETGFISQNYDNTEFDQDGGNAYVYPGTTADFTNFDGGYYTPVSSTIYTITFSGDSNNPQISLVPTSVIPANTKITANFGNTFGGLSFYLDNAGEIQELPYISAPLTTLYYQDGNNPNKVGIIKIIDSNLTNVIDITTDILGQQQYTSGNGVTFTNGLKVAFQNNVIPASYRTGDYYVQGVGTSIELIPVTDLISPEVSSEAISNPFDISAYDTTNYDYTLYVPIVPDYITIARNSIDRNAWSRSNRWFHVDVINATATYNQDPSILTTYATQDNKAKRPIIEFYPNLKLYKSGIFAKAPIDYVNNTITDAFSDVAGHRQFYPDTSSYTSYTANIEGVAGPITGLAIEYTNDYGNIIKLASGQTTNSFAVNDPIVFTTSIGGITALKTYYIYDVVDETTFQISEDYDGEVFVLLYDNSGSTATLFPRHTNIILPTADLFNKLEVGQYIKDLYQDASITSVLPTTAQVTNVESINGTTTISVAWTSDVIFATQTNASVVTANTTLDNYGLFDGARIVFLNDSNPNVRNKIYQVEFAQPTVGSNPVIMLTVADDGDVVADTLTVAFRGYNYAGYSFYFDGLNWNEAQTKTTINQPPLFDIIDSNGISLSNQEVYDSSSFTGTTLFSYTLGTGTVDLVLGFPLQYSSTADVGDINFTVSINSDTFNYVNGTNSITENIDIGYVYQYSNTEQEYIRQIGWQTAVSPSIQYQIFNLNYYSSINTNNTFTCDIELLPTGVTQWPLIQVYINNVYLPSTDYTYTTGNNQTTVVINSDIVLTDSTPVEILLLSDQVSSTGYYQLPINLSNNPLNENLIQLNLGEIRLQYQSICHNNPNIVGDSLGANNFRDLGNLVPWGNQIIQNSASLALPGTFLRNQNLDLFNSLQFNNEQYIGFKSLLINTVTNTAYNAPQTPAYMLDDAINQITLTKSNTGSFFWSDMLPSKTPYVTNTYTFANELDVSIYPLSQVYNFATSNYNSVLVYLTRNTVTTQLIINVDYVVSTTSPSLTVTMELLAGDVITVNEYNQTYGSYVPNTPTKLGLYPATIPNVFLDSDYQTPTYFIIGHDGSFTKLYGNYDPVTGTLNDSRDQVLLEFETRIYNNLKISNVIPIKEYEVTPGFFRNTDYSYDEWLEIYSESFLNWVGQNRIEYKTQYYNRNDQFTYNYRDNSYKLGNVPIEIGYWRGIYEYFYDTSTPNLTPWEMIGYSTKPAWWDNRYGYAPYTSDNLILWTDLQNGVDYNNGNPIVIPQCVRPNLLDVLPVDDQGNLLSPSQSVLGKYNGLSFQKDWIVGDTGPAEFAFRRSSSWPFTLMRLMALMKPAEFFNLGVDVDNYKYSTEFNQYLVNNRSHLTLSDISIYGSGTPVTSYINWIVDYEKQVGIDTTTEITNLLQNVDVRLVYRLAGFSDQINLRFYVEKGSPNSQNASLLIPDESYSVLLYNNQPTDTIFFSSVIVQITNAGYKVYGNSQTKAYFTVNTPLPGKNNTITIDNLSVTSPTTFNDTVTVEIPYGTTFYTAQEIATFLASYGHYLETQGLIFQDNQQGIEITWEQMIAEFLYWVQSGWDVGSIITLNPSAQILEINKENFVVQPLVLKNKNFILNQNLMPINLVDLNITRDGTDFVVQALNEGDTISYSQFEMSNMEHGIVFDNTTLFNDTIYNLVTGLRQQRIYVRGAKSAEWDGTMDAQGFIISQDNIQPWSSTVVYTKGSIVSYKNQYWSAIAIVQPNETFDATKWQVISYSDIQIGLLPNSSTNSYESTLYYDVNQANLKNDADLLSFSLIGYRPRDYLALADLTDITQVNVYQNLIKNKGTLNAASAFKGATLPQGGIDYTINENWAIKTGQFGGTNVSNFVDIRLDESLLPNNPSTVALTNGYNYLNADMEVPLYSIINYQKPITDPDIFDTLPTDTPNKTYSDAGYVNFNDVKMASYNYFGLNTAVNQYGTQIPLSQLYVGDYVWLANYLQKWQTVTPISIGTINQIQNNYNKTVTVTFDNPHNLTQYQTFAINNFNSSVDGYYIVTAVVDLFRVIINLTLAGSLSTITGNGIAFKFQSQRVSTGSEINNLPLLNSEFISNTVWVDTNDTGSWAVYQKNINYNLLDEITLVDSQKFGSSVAYTEQLGYLIGDNGLGIVNRYQYIPESNTFELKQTLSGNVSFGSYISYSDDIFVISETTGNVYVYQLVVNNLFNQLNLIQTINAPITTKTFGISTSISGDKNWIYVGDSQNNIVYVYRLSQDTNTYELVSHLSDSNLTGIEKFGISVSTDYYGDTVVIGAPNQPYNGMINVGYSYIFNRITQSFEALTNTNPQTFELVSAQTMPIFVNVNGSLLATNQYSVVDSTLNVYYQLNPGDIITVGTSNFVETQILDSQVEYNMGERFGCSVDTNLYASEILIGAPLTLDLAHDNNQEGTVFRYTNGGNKYGIIIGITPCVTTIDRTILLNGYAVTIPAGDATVAATAINTANILNVTATDSNGILVISLIKNELSIPNKKLTLQVLDMETLSELGINLYTQTELIVCPHKELHSQFGYTVKFNEQGSFVASAIVGNRYSATTFDYTGNIDTATIFDNNTTDFVDSFVDAGAVYMFDFISEFNESLMNPGAFVYAQSVNSEMVSYGTQPFYGLALDFNNYQVVMGSPFYQPNVTNGLVTIYQNTTGVKDWSVYRESGAIVDVSKIQNAQIYSDTTSNTLINLDYIDPLQGKILGAARQNLDYIGNVDPAAYNNQFAKPGAITWGANKVGSLWFNTSGVKFINYYQQDYNYNNKWWGKVFPGSDVAVYSYVVSNVVPSLYQGPGTPFNLNSYSIENIVNQSGTATPVYYFWVRNTNIVFQQTGKTLSDTIIETYITNPQTSGISYFTPVAPNAFSLYNSLDYINNVDSILHIGYKNGNATTLPHNEFTLIQSNNPDDFLPGLPSQTIKEPISLYEKLLDSAAGLDSFGSTVPDILLPAAVQSGVLDRPRQSFFYDRLSALNNIVNAANDILIQQPFNEFLNSKFLYIVGPTNPSTGKPFYTVNDYITNVNWWATGYNDSTKATIQVPIYADLATLNVNPGTIVSVAQNGAGLQETYIYNSDGTYTRIGLQYGTIQISSGLYDYADTGVGFDNSFFDTTDYDDFPSEPTRFILRTLFEELPQELTIIRNQLLILIFEYITEESIINQNSLTWLNKTSFIDVEHTIRELLPLRVYQSDNETFLEGYLNEVKPYHVVIKNFLFKYTGIDTFEGDITDFDVPAEYISGDNQFVSPQLVYGNPEKPNEFLPTDPIWQTGNYSQWFNNYGLSMTGQNDAYITKTKSYLALNTTTLEVDNVSGFPINGVIYIDSECISYSSVDRLNNLLLGLFRGYNGTEISNHIPGTSIYIDLPAALVLYGGRGYTNPPQVTAYIDTSIYPQPKQQASLSAVLTIDSVQSITVNNAGLGYATLPRIEIEPAFVINFTSNNVNLFSNTIQLSQNSLYTGDIIKYNVVAGSTPVQGLDVNQYYYVNVIETYPLVNIALFTTLHDCINNQNRVVLDGVGSGNHTLSLGAIASCITNASPIRENIITLKFDRTTFTSQVTDWVPGNFYGSQFAADLTTETLTSSNVNLTSTEPQITKLLASASGVVFEIENVQEEQEIIYSSRSRDILCTYGNTDPYYPNVVRINSDATDVYGPGLYDYTDYDTIPYDIPVNNPVIITSDSTIGFYVGMPIKFTGEQIGNLQTEVVYYIESLVVIDLQNIGFRVSTTYENAINGIPYDLETATASTNSLLAYPAENKNDTVLTVDYPGIRKVTQTNSQNNSLVIPITSTGTGGTQGLYTGLMLFFTGNVFGGIVENQTYYVTSVIDEQTFTISTTQDVVNTQVYGTLDSTDFFWPNTVAVQNDEQFAVNDPIIFDPFTVVDQNGVTTVYNEFGGIVAGQLYYVAEIVGAEHIRIASAFHGPAVTLTTFTPELNPLTYSTLVNQNNCATLQNSTGSMSAQINLPVSPGQVTGQEFTLYQTSNYFTDLQQSYIELYKDTVVAVIGNPNGNAINRVMLYVENNNYQIDNNMPVQLDQSIGGLNDNTTYYVVNTGNVSVTVTSTYASDNTLEIADTGVLFVGMPIKFSGGSLGGVLLNTVYYVYSIVSDTNFQISEALLSVEPVVVIDGGGIMIGTGSTYLQLSTTQGGPVITLTSETSTSVINITQTPSQANFAVRYILGGYDTYIIDGGSGFAIGNQILITGTQLGGQTPTNDLTMTVNTVDSNGTITSLIRSGTPAGTVKNYWMNAVTENQLGVFADPKMTVPVSSFDFIYKGVTQTNVLYSNTSNNTLIIADITDLTINDPVVFTGNVTGGLVAGQTYYITSVTSYPLSGYNYSAEIQISETLAGTNIILSTNDISCVIAKYNDFILLPEPFYFNQSIVKYNNKVWRCLISNSDTEFVFGKWELLQSGDSLLNAMDRAIGYYDPTINMPGLDLAQLYAGVEFPGATYKGNSFSPDEEFPIDLVLTDLPFYTTTINVASIVWNGVTYIAPANDTTNSLNLIRSFDYAPGLYDSTGYSTTGYDVTPQTDFVWNIQELSNSNLNVTSISYNSDTGVYIITANDPVTPLLISTDGINFTSESGPSWNGSGNSSPYDMAPFDTTPYDSVGVEITSKGLYASTSIPDPIFVPDTTYWEDTSGINYPVLYIAVGDGIYIGDHSYTYNAQTYEIETPYVWTNVYSAPTNTTLTLKDVQYFDIPNFNGFMTVGQIANTISSTTTESILVSSDGRTWSNPLSNPLGSYCLNAVASNNEVLPGLFDVYVDQTNNVPYDSTNFDADILATNVKIVAVGNNGTIYTTEDSITWNPQISGVSQNLNKVVFGNNIFIAVGDLGRILTSLDGNIWVLQNSGTTVNLNSIVYNADDQQWVVVGDNSTILQSNDAINWAVSYQPIAPETADYNVKGGNFTSGYSPEELVSGVIKDNLSMFINTRPGTNWDATIYQHVGYGVVSKEFTPLNSVQTVYSFKGMVDIPAQLQVFVIDSTTNTSTTLYPTQYSIDWIQGVVTLHSPISSQNTLRIDVYYVGNGDQLIKSNTLTDPIRFNSITGYSEIYLDCNYSAPIYNGSGIVKPGTTPQQAYATETRSSDSTILVDSVSNFVINSPITFVGNTFGNIEENVTYYVKSISYAESRIIVSASFSSGLAGPVYVLTDATGEMDVDIQLQAGTTWTDPIIYYNGNKLLPGHYLTVTKTYSGTNTVEVNTTSAINVGETVVFSDTLSSLTGLVPNFVYYITSIQSLTTFCVSETPNGPNVVLNNASGGSYCIIADYAFGIQPNGISAKLIFAGKPDISNPGYVIPYDQSIDYLTYTLFGENTTYGNDIPLEYGYTIPETEYITADGFSSTYLLTNYINLVDAENAIVELNGVRLVYNIDYYIDITANIIEFVQTPSLNSVISVTSYNNTDRQYFNTQYNLTGNAVNAIANISNNITPPQAVTVTSQFNGMDILVGSVAGMTVNATVIFLGSDGDYAPYDFTPYDYSPWDSWGNIVPFDISLTDGTVYYITSVDSNNNTFQVSTTLGGQSIDWTGPTDAVFEVVVGGQPAVRITTDTAHGFASPVNNNDLVRIDGVSGSIQLNNNLYYVHVINDIQVDLYTQPYNPNPGAVNYPVTQISSYLGDGYIWDMGSFIIADTTVISTSGELDTPANEISVDSTDGFVLDTPVVFGQKHQVPGTPLIGGIIAGKVYYIAEITSPSAFRISETQYGKILELTTETASGDPIYVSQWEQTNVDRLWVTVDGKRVPSSSLRINSGNLISILAPVSPDQLVTITSMMPSATPNQEIYMQNVDALGIPSVYRLSQSDTTWLTSSLSDIDTVIYVQDASKLVDIVTQTVVAPYPVDFNNQIIMIGLNADKNIISSISVTNLTTDTVLNSNNYTYQIVGSAPTLVFNSGVSYGDTLEIVTTEGNTIYINGEQIRFGSVDLLNNTLTQLQRGVNDTGVQVQDDIYSPVLSLLSKNRLPIGDYNKTWNSYTYNTKSGDPLQISTTYSANFLNQGQN